MGMFEPSEDTCFNCKLSDNEVKRLENNNSIGMPPFGVRNAAKVNTELGN
jgi:hypothetical protein